MPSVYRDRAEAGEILARRLSDLADRGDVIVLALPRGGVPVAFPVAQALHAPLDILAVRKLGVPGHEELAMGAIAGGGLRILHHDLVADLRISDDTVEAVTAAEQRRLATQEERFRAGRAPAEVAERTVIVVDDGLATGATMEAAIAACRQAGAAGIVVAVPVGPPSTVAHFRILVDRVECPATPALFRAVGPAYADFSPVADEEVIDLLAEAAARPFE